MAVKLEPLGRAFDSAPWRGVETAARKVTVALRRRRSSRTPPQRNVRLSLSETVARGGFDDAAPLVERALAGLGAMPVSEREALLPVCLRYFAAVGQADRASELARQWETELRATDAGSFALESLEIGEPALWLPSGRANTLGVGRMRRGGASPDELLRELGRRPWAFARQPELHLLVHNLTADSRPILARRSLNRYLRSQGVAAHVATALAPGGLASVSVPTERDCTGGPLVSVIMSAFNAADTIGYACRSILGQSYRNIELLVCDDASTDGTSDVLADIAQDRRVRVFRSTCNQGTYNVRNHLIERAQGELITFHDADDLALPIRIETQVDAVLDRGATLCLSNWLRVRSDGDVAFFADGRASRLSVVSLLARRELFEQLGPYPSARFGADLDYLQRAKEAVASADRARIWAPLIFGLWSGTSLTRRRGAEALESGFRAPARRRYLQYLFERASKRETTTDLEKLLTDTDNWIEPSALKPLSP